MFTEKKITLVYNHRKFRGLRQVYTFNPLTFTLPTLELCEKKFKCVIQLSPAVTTNIVLTLPG